MMKPILFNTDMVRAILDGRKTVTRRVMKPQPMFYTGRKFIFADDICPKKWESCDNIIETYQYQPDDILYVRETFAKIGEDVDIDWFENSEQLYNGMYIYKADGIDLSDIGRWHPSIHMPKNATRIFLRVTDVRVERLQDIDDESAKAEGANYGIGVSEKMKETAIDRFAKIWNHTVKKNDLSKYGWGANPFVWVIEFERYAK